MSYKGAEKELRLLVPSIEMARRTVKFPCGQKTALVPVWTKVFTNLTDAGSAIPAFSVLYAPADRCARWVAVLTDIPKRERLNILVSGFSLRYL
jgi:hypothetical protein